MATARREKSVSARRRSPSRTGVTRETRVLPEGMRAIGAAGTQACLPVRLEAVQLKSMLPVLLRSVDAHRRAATVVTRKFLCAARFFAKFGRCAFRSRIIWMLCLPGVSGPNRPGPN